MFSKLTEKVLFFVLWLPFLAIVGAILYPPFLLDRALARVRKGD